MLIEIMHEKQIKNAFTILPTNRFLINKVNEFRSG